MSSLVKIDEFGFGTIECNCIAASLFKSSFGSVFKPSAVLSFTVSYNRTCSIINVARCGCTQQTIFKPYKPYDKPYDKPYGGPYDNLYSNHIQPYMYKPYVTYSYGSTEHKKYRCGDHVSPYWENPNPSSGFLHFATGITTY